MLNYESFVTIGALLQSKSKDPEVEKHMLECYNKYLSMTKDEREAFITSNNIKPILRKLCRDLGINVI